MEVCASGNRRSASVASFWLLAIVLAACSGDGTGDPEAGVIEVRDSAGIRIVTSHVQPDDIPVYAEVGEADVEIGVVDGDPRYAFTYVVAARTLQDGGTLVVEGRAQEVRVFDGGGTHVRSFGGPGGGPGEFGQISSLAGVTGDTVWVWDARNRRLSTFLLDGRLLGDQVFEGEPQVVVGPMTRLSDGALLTEATALPEMEPDADFLSSQTLLRRTGPGGEVDTVAVLDGDVMAVQEQSTAVDGVYRTVRLLLRPPVPFGTHVAVGEEHLFVGRNDRYRVERRVHSGAADLIVEVPDLERRLEPAEFAAMQEWRLGECDDERCLTFTEASFERFDPPEMRPAYSDLRVDALGDLWVAEWQSAGVPVGTWHVFSSEGELLGVVAVPPGLDVHDVGADYVLGVQENELGVPFVKRFPLTRLR